MQLPPGNQYAQVARGTNIGPGRGVADFLELATLITGPQASRSLAQLRRAGPLRRRSTRPIRNDRAPPDG